FKDFTPILEDAAAFKKMLKLFEEQLAKVKFEKIVAIESRGFIIGSALAHNLDKGLVLARKPGKLPRETEKFTYALEYGEDTLEIHKSAIPSGISVVIVDDVLATGGTAHAVESICKNLGAQVMGHYFLMEIE